MRIPTSMHTLRNASIDAEFETGAFTTSKLPTAPDGEAALACPVFAHSRRRIMVGFPTGFPSAYANRWARSFGVTAT